MEHPENPWQTLSSRDIYENHWILLRENKVINPGGGHNDYGVVHFKNTALGIIPLDENDNTWLVGQHRYPLDIYSWEIPMGGGDTGQDDLTSAQRELQEETGITAGSWERIIEIHTSNSVTDEKGVGYIARELHFGEPDTEETEELTVRKLPFSEALDMVMNNEITDSLSVAAILKAARLMGY